MQGIIAIHCKHKPVKIDTLWFFFPLLSCPFVLKTIITAILKHWEETTDTGFSVHTCWSGGSQCNKGQGQAVVWTFTFPQSPAIHFCKVLFYSLLTPYTWWSYSCFFHVLPVYGIILQPSGRTTFHLWFQREHKAQGTLYRATDSFILTHSRA